MQLSWDATSDSFPFPSRSGKGESEHKLGGRGDRNGKARTGGKNFTDWAFKANSTNLGLSKLSAFLPLTCGKALLNKSNYWRKSQLGLKFWS